MENIGKEGAMEKRGKEKEEWRRDRRGIVNRGTQKGQWRREGKRRSNGVERERGKWSREKGECRIKGERRGN